MAHYDHAAGWCYVCAGRRAVERKHINHAGLFLVTLCTCGLTLPYWIWVATGTPWRCRACGSVEVAAGEARAEAAYWGETLPWWTAMPIWVRTLAALVVFFGAGFGVLVVLNLIYLATR